MKPYVKFGLILGVSFILAGCQLNKKESAPFPAPDNQITPVTTIPKGLLDKETTHQHNDGVLAYQIVQDSPMMLTVVEERYEKGERVGRELLLNLTQVDRKGYLALRVERLPFEKKVEGQDYQLTFKIKGSEKIKGEACWQVNAKEHVHPLVDYAITLPSKLLDTTVEETLFGVKFSTTEKPEALSLDFLKEPDKHLAEIGEDEVVYLFRSHFTEK